jgi:hypothetical protein
MIFPFFAWYCSLYGAKKGLSIDEAAESPPHGVRSFGKLYKGSVQKEIFRVFMPVCTQKS